MDFPCPKCAVVFRDLDKSLQGRPARCEDCGHDFMIPFVESVCLLEWAKGAEWEEIEEGMTNSIARGHDSRTIAAFLKIFEKKRFEEEWRIRRLQGGNTLSLRERKWKRSEKMILRHRTLERLRDLDRFKENIADLFKAQGYRTKILERRRRNGIDIDILDANGNKWGVTRCKIPATGTGVAPRHVRDFAGAYMLSGAEKGFLFTTGEITRAAEKIARQFDWLKTYDGRQLMEYMEGVRGRRG